MASNDRLFEYSIEGYKLFNIDCINKKGGGAALYMTSWFNLMEVSLSDRVLTWNVCALR